ncbi:iron chelate uptake ABC transporter family permease subunit [Pluralibacter gergoviae]
MPLSRRALFQALGLTLCFPGLCSFASSLRPFHVGALPASDDVRRIISAGAPADMLLAVVVCATLATASAVALAGVVGWVGLIVPHMARLLTGSNHQRMLPLAMVLGAILLLLTDTLARGLSATEIPLGIITAFIGAPFFLALLLRGGRT